MRVAILGDIHGNSLALESVLSAAKRLDVECLLITGDIVGYYFEPAKVMELLASWQFYMVRGNHENMLSAVRKKPGLLPEIEKRYGSGLRVALSTMQISQLDMLCNLPHPLSIELDNVRILLCHGSPWDNDMYIYPDANESLLKRCAADESDIIVTGHTHYPMLKRLGKKQLVNPGSVGQPRNRRPGAQWALLDTAMNEITLYNESYNIALVSSEARLRHPELPYLADVLSRI